MTSGTTGDENHVMGEAMELTWHPEARLAMLRFAPNIALGGKQGALLVESLAGWIFRIGTGIQFEGFADEARARAWLRRQGIGP
jgi:hypothetical protein